MTEIAMYMAEHNWVLRSGGANGADTAFETGAGEKKEIYLPFRRFNNNISPLFIPSILLDERAEILAKKVWNNRFTSNMVYVSWASLKDSTKKFMIRNMYQLCGRDLTTMSRVVICWTADGKSSGGTGQAIHGVEMMRRHQEGKLLKEKRPVPQVVNLYNTSSIEFIRDILRNNINPENVWNIWP